MQRSLNNFVYLENKNDIALPPSATCAVLHTTVLRDLYFVREFTDSDPHQLILRYTVLFSRNLAHTLNNQQFKYKKKGRNRTSIKC